MRLVVEVPEVHSPANVSAENGTLFVAFPLLLKIWFQTEEAGTVTKTVHLAPHAYTTMPAFQRFVGALEMPCLPVGPA